MGKVLVVGDVMTDIVVMPEGPMARGTDVRARIRQLPGGSGANQAVWLAAKGAAVRFAAKVGAGDVAHLGAHFKAAGVEAALAGDPQLPTGALVCLIDKDGERSFLTDRGANATLSAEDLPMSLLANVSLLHVSGYALIDAGPRAVVLSLMRAARQSGIPVSVDPSSTGFVGEVGAQNFLGWTAGADFLFPNAEEAELLSGHNAVERQLEVLTGIYGTVVLKRGALGATVGRRGCEAMSAPGRQVEVVDTTGAGDAFLAAYIAAWLRGEPDAECLESGIEAGAEAVTRVGARP